MTGRHDAARLRRDALVFDVPADLAPLGEWLLDGLDQAVAGGLDPLAVGTLACSDHPPVVARFSADGDDVRVSLDGPHPLRDLIRWGLRGMRGADLDEAVRLARRALDLDADLPTRAEAADVFQAAGLWQEAEQLVAPDVDDSPVSLALWARSRAQLGDADAACPALARVLADAPDPAVRKLAADELATLGALEPLVDACLRDPEDELRRHLSCLLQEVDVDRANAALAEALAHDDPAVAANAAAVFEQHLDPEAVDLLVGVLETGVPQARRLAAGALGKLYDERATAPLAALLQDADPEVRAAAAWALGDLASSEATDELIAALDDPTDAVRAFAARALGEMRAAPAVAALTARLGDAYVPARRWAANALAEIDDPASAPALVAALRDADPEVRQQAARALGNWPDAAPDSVPPLIALLDDADDEVVWTAVDALAALNATRASAPLLALLERPPASATTALAAVEALLAFGSAPGDLIPPITRFRALVPTHADDPDDERVRFADAALDRLRVLEGKVEGNAD